MSTPPTPHTIEESKMSSPAQLVSGELRRRLHRRIASEHSDLSDTDIDAAVGGALGFLHLCADHPGHAFTPSRRIDIAWHAFILHTRDYHAFCQATAGRYIHHEPSDGKEGSGNGLERTVRFMEERGIPFDPEVWAASADCEADCEEGSCENCRADCSGKPG